jgi:hypothetical protein
MPSSVIGSYSYDPESADLTIRYVSGLVYCYRQVPQKVFKEFKASLVKGRYLNYHIKGKYAYEKVQEL